MAKATAANGKRALISKANSMVVLASAGAAFIVVFSLIASKTLFSQMAYQNRVITEKHKALAQLKTDKAAASALDASYNTFISTPQNAIGGFPDGTGSQDGNNAKIVLDALPSTYDFPALVTSIEKLIGVNGASIGTIGGSDDEVAQGGNQASATPQPVTIPFTVSVSGNYQAMQSVISQFEHSIRPMQIQTMSLSGSQDDLSMNLSVQTFYQPAKTFNISTKVVK